MTTMGLRGARRTALLKNSILHRFNIYCGGVMTVAVRDSRGFTHGTRLDIESHRRTFFAVDIHLGKSRYDGKVQLILLQVAARNRNGFDCLIHGARADRLHFGFAVLPNHTRDGAGDGGGARLGGNFDGIHVACYSHNTRHPKRRGARLNQSKGHHFSARWSFVRALLGRCCYLGQLLCQTTFTNKSSKS